MATVVREGTATDDVAERALNVTAMLTANMDEATNSGNVQRIVATTVDVFQGVARHISSNVYAEDSESSVGRRMDAIEGNKTAEKMAKLEKLREMLKARADNLCTAVTKTTAPGAAPVGSASDGLSYNCQKIQRRGHGAGPKESSKQVQYLDMNVNRLSAC